MLKLSLTFCSDKIHQGGGVAAPVGGQVFSEILPYLEVSQGNKDEIEEAQEVKTPNIEGLNLKEAQKIVKELGLELSIEDYTEELDKENTMIVEQTPKEGINVKKGSKIYLKIKNWFCIYKKST